MPAETGICKLCRNTAQLCRSHIVPEFAYKPMKNERNQIMSLGRKVRRIQSGYSERMLCAKCESLLSDYEREFKQIWMDTIPADFAHLRTRSLQDVIAVAVPNHNKFKLFHLSVLWRASVSDGFRVERFTLGPYERVIAKMLMEEDAGAPGDFPVFGFLNVDSNGYPVAMIAPLARGHGRFEGHHYYGMPYAFCDWNFIIAQPGPRWLIDFEVLCRRERQFMLLVVNHKQSKQFKLAAEMIRRLQN